VRNHPDQSDLARELDFIERISWASSVARDFVDIYATHSGDRDLIYRILALEDRRFFLHRGVDWTGVGRELRNALAGQPMFGASTISMQVVRIATGYFTRSMSRKLVEVLAARGLEKRQRKWRILTAYYNSAYLGSGVLDWEDLTQRLTPFFRDVGGVTYEVLASCLASPMPTKPSDEWIARTLERASRISVALSNFPLSPDQQRIIVNNIKHVPIKGVRLAVQ
jgi:hypothetical protein